MKKDYIHKLSQDQDDNSWPLYQISRRDVLYWKSPTTRQKPNQEGWGFEYFHDKITYSIWYGFLLSEADILSSCNGHFTFLEWNLKKAVRSKDAVHVIWHDNVQFDNNVMN